MCERMGQRGKLDLLARAQRREERGENGNEEEGEGDGKVKWRV
jgi:hypothetical protein